MRLQLTALITLLLITAPFTSAIAETDRFQDSIDIFKNAGESGRFFDDSYAYAVFPSVGRAGVGIGGARGTSRDFRQGEYVADNTMTQLTVGLQLGAQGYRMIVFLEDVSALSTSSRVVTLPSMHKPRWLLSPPPLARPHLPQVARRVLAGGAA